MQKLSTVLLVLLIGCSVESPSDSTSTEAVARKNKTVTSIIVNGRSATVALLDSAGTNGFLTATKDQVANTTGLDFSWATPDATNPDLAILYQGAGEIPNAAFTQNATNAQLNLTTPAGYAVTRCIINLNDGTFTCAASAPLTFNLSWLQNGFGSVQETTKRVETLGPVTTKVKAEFTTVTATVNGTWGGRSSPNLGGDLTDSQSKTYIREITVTY